MCFDIDKMIEIAETKAMETGDELWLLQTDLDYFHDLMKHHEREWLDSVPRMEEVKQFSPKDKMDNIGYMMTVKVVIQARDWQWLLDQCQTVKEQMRQPEADTRVGDLEPQLAMMKQGDSRENKAQLGIERQQILGRLRAGRQRAMAKSAIPPKDIASGFPAHSD